MKHLRVASRALRQKPGFAALVVLTLSLGIGATTAVLSLIEGVLLAPLPYLEPERIFLVESAEAKRPEGGSARSEQPAPTSFAAAQWLDWRENADTVGALAAYHWTFNFLILDDGSRSLEGMGVTPGYFEVTGLEPVLGRAFEPSDAEPGAAPVVLIGYELWQQAFGADPDIVGRTFRMSRLENPPTILGVMPRGVRFLPAPAAAQEPNYDIDALVDFWSPAYPETEYLEYRYWNVVLRLENGIEPAESDAELNVRLERVAEATTDLGGQSARLTSLPEFVNREGRRILLPLLAAAALVLLIACGNVAALLLVRGLQRQREYGVRAALGAGRAQLFFQVTVESLLLALGGAAAGSALAVGIVGLLRGVGHQAIPRLDAVEPGWPTFVSAALVAVVAALLASLYPALRASRFDPVRALNGSGTRTTAGAGERRLLRAVTVAQTALTMALLVGAGLLLRTMANLANVSSGYDTSQVLTMTVTSMNGREGGPFSSRPMTRYVSFHTRALERVEALPGVDAAAFAWGVPLTGNHWPARIRFDGPRDENDGNAEREGAFEIPLRSVTAGYFELLGQRVVEGRDFRTTDGRESTRVAIVNETLAARHFPGSSGLGQRFWLGENAWEIVGVVSDGRTESLSEPAEPEVYLSLWQSGPFSKHLVVQTAVEPLSIAGSIQKELRQVEPTVAIENVETLERIRGDSEATRSFARLLLVGFAGVAMALTVGGIYGVQSLSVASRKRELALRAAVGAERRGLRRLVLGEGIRLLGVGVVLGALISVPLARILDSLLFEVESSDPSTLLISVAALSLFALAACWVPAERAARIRAVEAFREE